MPERRQRLFLAAAILGGSFAVAAPAGADISSFFQSINPFEDTQAKYDGRFIDSLTPQPWSPSLVSLEPEPATAAPSFGPRSEERETAVWAPGPEPSAALDESPSAAPVFPDDAVLIRLDSGFAPLPAVEDYLNGLARRLLQHSPITGAPIKVRLSGSSGFGRANAYPGGTIAIPWATLRNVGSTDAMAFLLGHEIAHVLLGHHDSDWFSTYEGRLVGAAEVALAGAIAISQKFGKGDEIAGKAGKYLLIAQGLLFASDVGLFPSWQREQEDEADLLGLDLMIRAGFSPDAAFDFLSRLEEWQKSGALQEKRAAERAALDQEIEAEGEKGNLGAAFSGVLNKMGNEIGYLIGEAKAAHRDTAERIVSLDDYYLREYEDKGYVYNGEGPDKATWKRLINARDNVQVLDAYEAAYKARKLLGAGDTKGAEGEARVAVSGGTSKHSYPRLAFYGVRAEQGKRLLARKNLEIALQGPAPSLDVYRNLSQLHGLAGNKESALEIMQSAWDEFEAHPLLYPDLIYLHQSAGDEAQAKRLRIECQVKARKLSKACESALKGEVPE